MLNLLISPFLKVYILLPKKSQNILAVDFVGGKTAVEDGFGYGGFEYGGGYLKSVLNFGLNFLFGGIVFYKKVVWSFFESDSVSLFKLVFYKPRQILGLNLTPTRGP